MIAVTGANGLLGSFIIERLAQEKLQVIAITRKKIESTLNPFITWKEADVTDPVCLAEVLQGVSCVIHTAAMVSFHPGKTKNIMEANVTGTKNVVDACLALGIKRLIHVSSVGALGKPKNSGLITEDTKWIAGSFNTDYAESKYLAELEVYRAQEEGISISIINPSVILAHGDWSRSSAKLFKFVWDEKPFYTQGQFNYVDVRDITEMIFRLYQSGHETNGEKFIASAGSISFLNFFQQVAQRFGKKPPSIKVSSGLLRIAALLESVRCRITGAEPLFVSKTLRANRENFVYANQKATKQLKMQFHTLDETLDWCCQKYLADNTINK